MEVCKFTVPGTPQGKGRPRVTKYGTFTPEKTKQYEELVRWSWRAAKCKPLANQPLEVLVYAYFTPPKSASKKKQNAMLGAPYMHKPDADNIAKAILDALNGIAYADDSAVVSLTVEKFYAETARVDVVIRVLTEMDYDTDEVPE